MRREIRSMRPRLASAVIRDRADANANRIAPFVALLRSQGILSPAELARNLNEKHVLTPGGGQWTPTKAAKLLRRLEAMESLASS
jgi:hypothetical protein